MIKKEKVFELKIEDDDELSGIDSISLVDEPAIEVNWVAFSKEKEHEFHIPDNEDDIYLEKLLAKGQPEQELLDEGWEIDRIESVKENFATAPNQESYEDNEFYRTRYKYALSPNIKQSAIIPTTRQFCKQLINKNYVWRIEEIESEVNSFGQSAQFWRGGFNCRHQWYRIFYKRSGSITNKSSANKSKITVAGFPVELSPEWIQPDTVTSKTAANPSKSTIRNLGLKKEQMESISDYPESIKNNAKAVLKWVEENGWGSCGTPVGKARVNQLAKGEPISEETVKRMYSYLSRHKGDLESSKGYGDGCGKLMYDSWGGKTALSWAESKVKTFAKQDFEKVSIDYDDTLSTDKGKELAKRLLADGNDLSIITRRQESDLGPVYKVAEDLGIPKNKVHATNGKLKWETIKRLGIQKHIDNNQDELDAIKKNVEGVSTEKFGYDVGGIGGYVDPGIEKKKKLISKPLVEPTTFLDQFEYLNPSNFSKQYFQISSDEKYKKIVLGPAMIPDQKIFRKDEFGNPYYVFFSKDTIKMIAEKYMRNKFIDNNDQMHDGKAIKDIHVLESWIKESENDKSTDYGYGDLPVGTWFVSMKVNNDQIWEKVKSKELNGFSVSGFFSEERAFSKEEMFLYQVAEILKKY